MLKLEGSFPKLPQSSLPENRNDVKATIRKSATKRSKSPHPVRRQRCSGDLRSSVRRPARRCPEGTQ